MSRLQLELIYNLNYNIVCISTSIIGMPFIFILSKVLVPCAYAMGAKVFVMPVCGNPQLREVHGMDYVVQYLENAVSLSKQHMGQFPRKCPSFISL